MYSENGIRTMSAALVRLAQDPRDIEARSDAMHGAWLCGMTLMSSGTTIHHKIAHVLGGGFGLPHGPTHAVVLPHSTSYNRDEAPDAMASIGRAFDVPPDCVGSANVPLHEATIKSVEFIFGHVPESGKVMDVWLGKARAAQAAE